MPYIHARQSYPSGDGTKPIGMLLTIDCQDNSMSTSTETNNVLHQSTLINLRLQILDGRRRKIKGQEILNVLIIAVRTNLNVNLDADS